MKQLEDSEDQQRRIERAWYVLPLIVIAQFCGTSLWFASNGVLGELTEAFKLPETALQHLTASVQLGFIFGTLVFALLTLADRFSPSRVFFLSAMLGALGNLGMIWEGNTIYSLLSFRFITGFFLAGIYPVGMKIAADYYNKGLGTSLGYLVGALVLGTAFPHLLTSTGHILSWQMVIQITSLVASVGGVLIVFLADGPFRRPMPGLDLGALFRVFKNPGFRSAAFGYFGHMWELYTFWAFVPIILSTYLQMHPRAGFPVSIWAFLVIGLGGPACVLSGYLSRSFGEKKVATLALILSGICCLLLPWAFFWKSEIAFLGFMVFWGMVVIADSPLFSTLVARNAPQQEKGTGLTIVTCIGFAITIVSIEALASLQNHTTSPESYWILALGPLLGVLALSKKRRGSSG